MNNNICFSLTTQWNTVYELDRDDGQGNVPKLIKPMENYYEVFFTHNKFSVRVHAVSLARFGDWERIKAENKTISSLMM
jgi:hypothetical protein